LDPAPPDPVDQDPAASDIVVTHQVTGLDVSQRRLSTTRAITKRLGQDHHITLLEGDATTDNWWDGTPYSHILLDAPCSGSGTWRRNPDLKVLLREDSLLGHQQLQLKLLNNLWCMLDSTGSLLYCTCSILQEENDQVIRQFLAHQQTALQQPHVVGIDLPTGHATEFGWQLLPTDHLTDGFYFAVLSKSQHATTERLRL
jgi:16S rRNA (cytosine967-C5)-methyltransferase